MIGTSILGLSSLAGFGLTRTMGGNFYHILFSLSIACAIAVIITSFGTRILKKVLG